MMDAVTQEAVCSALSEQFRKQVRPKWPVETAVTEVYLNLSQEAAILLCVRRLSMGGRIIDAPLSAPQPSVCAMRAGLTSRFPLMLLACITPCDAKRVKLSVYAAAGVLPLPGLVAARADDFLNKVILEYKKGAGRS